MAIEAQHRCKPPFHMDVRAMRHNRGVGQVKLNNGYMNIADNGPGAVWCPSQPAEVLFKRGQTKAIDDAAGSRCN